VVAGWAEAAGLTREGQRVLMTILVGMDPGEALVEVSAVEKVMVGVSFFTGVFFFTSSAAVSPGRLPGAGQLDGAGRPRRQAAKNGADIFFSLASQK